MTARPAVLDAAYDAALAHARKQVQEIRGFYTHAGIYVLVITGLWVLNALTGGEWWVQWPMVGWGIGVACHGFSVFAGRTFFGPEWEARKVAELMARENLRLVTTEKELMHAQLRLLQAQIEPHFLFNTLANVQSLIARQPREATAMLDHFITYLRESLAASRAQTGTLAQEFALLRHYLELIQIRMGPRLAFELDLPPDLAHQPLAPMLLQPLVENAIRHGLEPKVEGGRLTVQARRGDTQVHLTVADDGLGFGIHADSAGTGLGLAHTRERLAMLYDGRATLSVTDAQPGTRVTMTLPLTTA
ncbi:MAG: 2TM domain-containing protein [Proteobacteria bacterium]|nr:2TM domain-containing protein [Pseudomonadota bacterium]